LYIIVHTPVYITRTHNYKYMFAYTYTYIYMHKCTRPLTLKWKKLDRHFGREKNSISYITWRVCQNENLKKCNSTVCPFHHSDIMHVCAGIWFCMLGTKKMLSYRYYCFFLYRIEGLAPWYPTYTLELGTWSF
jgi:hypothetical protein